MTSKRTALLAAALPLAIAAALPAGASARAGWKAEKLLTGGSYHIHSVATLCGSSKFGTYHIKATGSLQGKTLDEKATVPLLNDGHPHAFHVVSVGGTLITSQPPSVQTVIRNAVSSALSHTTVTITHVSGNTITTSGHFPSGAPSTGHVTLTAITNC